ncbi:MAG TPA: MFS transporter [Usitatibacter sp.]|nr:MFS transporter [Usitatibacter sp.]
MTRTRSAPSARESAPPTAPTRELPVGPVLALTTATQSFSTFGILCLAAVAPAAAASLGVSPALIGYQVGIVFFGAMLSAAAAGGIVARYGAVRASQFTLWLIAAGCAVSAAGSLYALAAGAVAMGLGYGIPNPAASHLLARIPSRRSMNLLYSIKQTGVPIGGILSGLIAPPLTLAFGWQAAMIACALLLGGLGVGIGLVRKGWDTDREPGAPVLSSMLRSAALVWRHRPLRWVAAASFLYSGVQMSLTGFLATYLVGDIRLSLVLAGTVLSITHAGGAVGRLAWGWFADRVRSGGYALMVNGLLTSACALITAAMAPRWPIVAVIAASAACGFSAVGWNGVFMAVLSRLSPPGNVGFAVGGSLVLTYAGVIVVPPAFAALHDKAGLSYGAGFALLSLVTLAGVACIWRARRASASAPRPA